MKISPRSATWCLVALIFIAFTTLFALTPVCLDDLGYLDYYNQAVAAAGDSGRLSARAFCKLIEIVRFEENGRPGNVLCPLWILCLPSWVNHILLGAMATGMVWGIAALASQRKPDMATLLVAWCLATFLLPWRARLFVVDYALNYIPATLLMMLWLWLFVHTRLHRGYVGALSGFLVGLLAGMQHEGLCSVMIFAVGIYWLLCRMLFPPRQWILVAGFAVGTVLLLSSEGIWLKMEASNPVYSLRGILLGATAIVAFVASMIAVCAVPSWRSSIKALLRNPMFLMPSLIALAGLLTNLFLGFSNARSTWFSQVMAVVVIVMIVRKLPVLVDKKQRIWAVGAAGMVTVLFYAAVIYWQAGYYRIYSSLDRQLQLSDTGTLYADINTRCPHWLLQMPLFSLWTEPTHLVAANLLYRDRLVAAVPTALKSFDRSRLKPVAGNLRLEEFDGVLLMRDRELYRIDGHGNPVPSTVESSSMNLRAADGTFYPDAAVNLIRFVAAPNDTMIWVCPIHWSVKGPFIEASQSQSSL